MTITGRLLIALLMATFAPLQPSYADGAQFWVSFDADRSNPVPLDSRQLQGSGYVFLIADSPVKEVRFFLDDPKLSGKAKTIDREAPFDLIASSSPDAAALDTTQLADGSHSVTANVLLVDGTTTVASASFEVKNMQVPEESQAPPQPAMVFSRAPDRSGVLQPLANSMVKGKIYPFMIAGRRMARVQYLQDGQPTGTRRSKPFDLRGGNTNEAKPLDTTFLADGTHILAAKVDFPGGELALLRFGFTVANNPRDDSLGFLSVSSNLLDFGQQQVGTAGSAKTLVLTNTGHGPVDIEKIDVEGDYDSSSNTCGTLEPGENCSISINFLPASFDSLNGFVSIVSNAQNPQVLVNLVGISSRY